VKSSGTVYLVGAGPGDAELLTLRGADLLGRADVVVYDALVNPDLLRLAPQTAELICTDQRAEPDALTQGKLNALLVARARAGQCVVRLQGGDPYTFSRGGAEASDLAAAKVPFEVVPGVLSAIAAPNYAGIPVTHPDHCFSFTVVTGHEDQAKQADRVDWAQIAQTPGTKIVMMGSRPIELIARQLIAHGMAPSTPVAMVRSETTGRQQSIEGTLATIAQVAAQAQFAPASITVIGDVVRLRAKLNWFERRPLFGQRIVVTRAREQAGELARRLQELGAEVLEIPTIKTVPSTRLQDLSDAILGLNAYDWLVFTSPNGVTWFFDYFFKGFDDLRDIGGVHIAAVGPATAAKLRELHLKVDVMPKEYVATKIAKALTDYESMENLRICLLRAEVANPELPKTLEALGAIVDDIPCYRTVPETDDVTGATAKLLADGADWIIFTSGSTVENFHARFNLPELLRKFARLRPASIGPETSKAMARLGVQPAIEAKTHTLDALVKDLVQAAVAARNHPRKQTTPRSGDDTRVARADDAVSPGG
jgi:uroporphyrinogen III methyltransferase/synthase